VNPLTAQVSLGYEMNYRRSSILFILVVLGCMAFTGCGAGAKSSGNSVSSANGNSSAAPAAVVAPASLTFSSQVLNTTSPADIVTLTNTGNASLSLASVKVTGNFAQSNNCGTSLPAGASCTVSVTFTPTAVGSRSGTVSFADNAPQSPQVAHLYGTGVTAGTLAANPTSVSFGTVPVGQTGSQTLTLTNGGGQSITVSSVSRSGAGLALSGISVPLTLAPGQSSSFNVTYTPTTSGTLSGTVYLTNNGPTTSISIPVAGTAAAAPPPQVILQWSASSSSVIGYNTYRGTVSGGPYTELTASPVAQTSSTDQSVQAGNTYFYVVTAVGTNGVESRYSSPVEAVVPTM
jgi:hypothetical protein